METLLFWVNCFIPNSVCELRGEIFALRTPPVPLPRFFAGDQRDFSSDINALSRIHSEVTINGLSGQSQTFTENSFCGETIEVDADGNTIGTGTASSSGVRFFNLRGSQTVDPEGGIINGPPGSVQIDFVGTAGNPLMGAPTIDYSGTLVIDVVRRIVSVSGARNGFPAYEMYCVVDGNEVQTLLNAQPISPLNLFGEENVPYTGSVFV
jgi:hypothetical protein